MYGQFIQTVIDFLIIALSIFIVIRVIGRFRRKEAEKEAEEKKEILTKEQQLLTEIRDLLKEKKE